MENKGKDTFTGFVLLASPDWDVDKLKTDLLEEWDIAVQEPEGDEEPDGDTMVFDVEGYMTVISLMPAPVPAGEAEYYAKSNYFWKGAVDAASEHRAHIMIAVTGGGEKDSFAAGKLFVKVAASCLKQENATAIYTSGTVFAPDMYCEVAADMNTGDDYYPVLDWIYFGLYQTEKGMNGYTYGMTAFGKDEIEVVESTASPAELHEFLFDMACYVLYDDVLLKDGETIGFSEDEKLPITRSKGAAVEGDSLKIAFMPA